MTSKSPTLSDGKEYLSKLFLVLKNKNHIFDSFIFTWFSIIHFDIIYFTFQIFFDCGVAWLKGFDEGVIFCTSWQVIGHIFFAGTK